MPTTAPEDQGSLPGGLTLDVEAGVNPWTHLDFQHGGGRFTFALISDRTGAPRPGVFERALACVEALRPRFAIQLGDLIQGYADRETIDLQWKEIDAMFEGLQVPVFHVPGNHDLCNPGGRDAWRERCGRTYYHFLYEDVLFCVVDTQDENGEMERKQSAPRTTEAEVIAAWNGTMPVRIGSDQAAYFEDVLARHTDVRWTFLLMHMPAWQGDGHSCYSRIEAALGSRRHTAISGHVHNYKQSGPSGSSRIRLGPSGGGWVLPGPEGNFDHVTLVTTTDGPPSITNILLDGIRDESGQPIAPSNQQ